MQIWTTLRLESVGRQLIRKSAQNSGSAGLPLALKSMSPGPLAFVWDPVLRSHLCITRRRNAMCRLTVPALVIALSLSVLAGRVCAAGNWNISVKILEAESLSDDDCWSEDDLYCTVRMLVNGNPAPYAIRASAPTGPASRPERPALRRCRPAKSDAYPERSRVDQNHERP